MLQLLIKIPLLIFVKKFEPPSMALLFYVLVFDLIHKKTITEWPLSFRIFSRFLKVHTCGSILSLELNLRLKLF